MLNAVGISRLGWISLSHVTQLVFRLQSRRFHKMHAIGILSSSVLSFEWHKDWLRRTHHILSDNIVSPTNKLQQFSYIYVFLSFGTAKKKIHQCDFFIYFFGCCCCCCSTDKMALTHIFSTLNCFIHEWPSCYKWADVAVRWRPEIDLVWRSREAELSEVLTRAAISPPLPAISSHFATAETSVA